MYETTRNWNKLNAQLSRKPDRFKFTTRGVVKVQAAPPKRLVWTTDGPRLK